MDKSFSCCEIEPADDEQSDSVPAAAAASVSAGDSAGPGAVLGVHKGLASSSITLGCMDRIWELSEAQQQQLREGWDGYVGDAVPGATPLGASSSSSISKLGVLEGNGESLCSSSSSAFRSRPTSSSSGRNSECRQRTLSKASITLAQLYHLKYDCPSCAASMCSACGPSDPCHGSTAGPVEQQAAGAQGDGSTQTPLLTPRGVSVGIMHSPQALAAAGIRSRSWQQLLVQPLGSVRKRAGSFAGQLGGYHCPQVMPYSRSSSSSGSRRGSREAGGEGSGCSASSSRVGAAVVCGGAGEAAVVCQKQSPKVSSKGALGAGASKQGSEAEFSQVSDGVHHRGGWTSTSRGSSFGGTCGKHRQSFELPVSSGVSAALGASRSHISSMFSEALSKGHSGSLIAVSKSHGAAGEGKRPSRHNSVVLTAQSLGGAFPGCVSERLMQCFDMVEHALDAAAAHGAAVAGEGNGALSATATAAASRRSSVEGSGNVCGVCMDKVAWVAVVGCGHLLCGDCAVCLVEGGVGCRPARCPFCRCAIGAFGLAEEEGRSYCS
jgi:hypothetical protein